ncbi:hypothetical protein GDO81_018155 [Engystomops pustulosus]|uniref:Protein FAM227A n=1 Tax=Engystomops pustulosus TaxID=76066 RepID=A0AAV7AEZ7_ENGPU|nr:hypothetical protein GDO81_018155 [Engystomops pustulosus]
MDSINRLNSPMALCVEDLTEHPLELKRRREMAQKSVQEAPVSFRVGSMESISQKIAHLEQQLKSFHTDDLEIESQEMHDASMHAGRFTPWYNSMEQRTQTQKKNREKNKKDLQKFTHRYQLSMTKTEFAKYPKTYNSTKKEVKAKPKLIELYQFPGFSYQGPLPLPYDISLNSIIGKVVSAHMNTGAKICPTKELLRILHTPVAQKILLDCFWWIFLHSYKPDADSQDKLFGRVAENYIQLLTLCRGSYNGDSFLNIFPSVLSQAVYCSFCFAFPQSLSQFQSDDFKAKICSLLWQWSGGIHPRCGVYNNWDFKTLEPKDDAVNNKVKQKRDSRASWFGLLNAEEKSGISTPLSIRSRKYSVFKPSRKNSSAANQLSSHMKEAALSISNKHFHHSSDSEEKVEKLKTETRSKETLNNESQPDCHKLNSIHMLFNLSGHSPLVQYYLEKRKVDGQAGVSVLVHRTEIQKQISSPFIKS